MIKVGDVVVVVQGNWALPDTILMHVVGVYPRRGELWLVLEPCTKSPLAPGRYHLPMSRAAVAPPGDAIFC